VAMEQEWLATVQENRAKVILAEAEVPLAIADAFRKGNLGVTDYYQLRNIQADTEMRSTIAGHRQQRPGPGDRVQFLSPGGPGRVSGGMVTSSWPCPGPGRRHGHEDVTMPPKDSTNQG